MKLAENKFKKALKNKQSQFGLWLNLSHAISTEICAGAGFDWLLIDAEHGPNEVTTVLNQLQAMAAYPVQAIVRPLDDSVSGIKQLLDIGAQTLLVPMVETAEQAETLVKAIQYPPKGIRGVGSAVVRASGWNRISDYLQKADDEICLIVQVESQKGLDNLNDIVQVDGVDGVFIGPADLAASLGFLGQPSHPEVVKQIEKAIKTITAAGKAAGTMATTKELIEKYLDCGVSFVGIGADTLLLANASSDLAAEYKSGLKSAKKSDGAY